jgi:para-aminobenzoate synthetase component 1
MHPRNKIYFDLDVNPSLEKILSWGERFNPFIVLNSNSGLQLQQDSYHAYNLIIGAGQLSILDDSKNVFDSLEKYYRKLNDWLFGYLSYDVKNQVEKLTSENYDGIGAEESYFFQPKYVLEFSNKKLCIHYLTDADNQQSIELLIKDFINHSIPNKEEKINSNDVHSRVSKEEYINNVNDIKKHIKLGNVYEMNYCIEFFMEDSIINPNATYIQLNNLSPMPFSSFCHLDDLYILSASPERFLARRNSKIISQPIKGTIKRGKNEEEDLMLIESLRNDPKEQSENVMIVDLVRNDLSRTAAKGSVKVEELFGIKTFKQLHQMVSTITSEMKTDIPFTDVIKYAFPMGSMTGAPKFRAMELIEKFEKTKRGIYSGSIGYIKPGGDFDFNVVIRSILYNTKNRYLSFMAGSAITDSSDPEKEYEECLLKAEAMKNVLGQPEKIAGEHSLNAK